MTSLFVANIIRSSFLKKTKQRLLCKFKNHGSHLESVVNSNPGSIDILQTAVDRYSSIVHATDCCSCRRCYVI